ncbi:1,4-dihydroxy-2-naphthoate prenyltransferase [Anaerosporomusa subterranea]|uniref:1,4-dihydroxy-2-naphthoate prenyltransferase n=1 Tax=Anaerosporomusa subterranea TaxID=1794912 RepID=A0A154BVJ6_ANASB|nr:1,4-dihydroxy-2-naphthoate polyprenyltransferase [Anaerosporomusa subterranea]KYZ78006.1 1,4-dihydroxy-2-naphthoate prenyltransferase [Anaerosporomusa subterranea]
MNLKSFFDFVEIRTKLASVTPFLIGTLYALYKYDSFKFENAIIMFISLFAFDMATTGINNYLDYKKAHSRKGYNYEKHNAVVNHDIKESTALAVIVMLLTTATALGVFLTLKTDIVVLVIGVLSFTTGILYTFGPVPISRMPLGEVFSGFFMGFIIIFLAVYIHIFDQGIALLSYSGTMLTIHLNLIEVLSLFLFSIPAIAGIGNIMLANNICDLDEDILNKRYTLPHYIGKEKALKLFKASYDIGYFSIIIAVVLNVAPTIILLAILTKIVLDKNIKRFAHNPSKREPFVLAVKNFIVVNGAVALLLGIAVVEKYVF